MTHATAPDPVQETDFERKLRLVSEGRATIYEERQTSLRASQDGIFGCALNF